MARLSVTYIVAFAAISYYFFKYRSNLPPVYGGKYLPEFRSVAEKFKEQVLSGQEIGGSFAAYYKGRLIVNLWGGYADKDSLQQWRNDTLPMTFSTTKGVGSILAAKMVDKNLLDYKALVSKYWPEFGCNGKENVTVEMLLHHMGGLSYLSQPISLLELHHNPSKVDKILETEKPKWPPGTAMAYHSLTFGAFVDRLLTKADPKKRRVDQLFREEIGKPFGIDFHIGLPLKEAYRASRTGGYSLMEFMLKSLSEPSMWWIIAKVLQPDNMLTKASKSMKEEINNNPYLREIAITSVSGHGTAESLAKLYGILANNGKYGDKQLLSQKTLDAFTAPKKLGISMDMGLDTTMGRGVMYQYNQKGEPVFGHPGYGGQNAFADPKNNIGMAYLTNDLSVYGFGNDPKFKALAKEFYNCIEQIKKSDLSVTFENL